MAAAPSPGVVRDRVTGAALPPGTVPDPRHPLGRYVTGPGSDVVIPPHPADPDPVLVAAVHTVALDGGERIDAAEPLAAVAATSPVVSRAEVRAQLEPGVLEVAAERGLRFLAAACFAPATRLSPVDRLVPVSRSRRVTNRTIDRLSAHSEDWALLRTDGVRPERVLSPHRDIDVDLYENRVVARLVRDIGAHLTRRLQELRTLDDTMVDARRHLEDAGRRPHLAARGLWELLDELLQGDDWTGLVAQRRRETERLQSSVMRLRGSPLWTGVDRRAPVEGTLRSTNLFGQDHRYRQVAELWRTYRATRNGQKRAGDGDAALRTWCRDFDVYVLVLVLRAAQVAGWVPADGPAPTRSGLPATFRVSGRTMNILWAADGVLTLSSSDEILLRVVSLPHPVTGGRNASTVAAELDKLECATTEVPTAVVYPAERDERSHLPLPLRLRVFQDPASPAPHRQPGQPYLLPVSPRDVDSVVRVARTLRWAAENARLGHYPRTVRCPSDTAGRLADPGWLAADRRGLVVTAPADPADQAALRVRLERLERPHRQVSDPGLRRQLGDDLAAAVSATQDMVRCPICAKAAPLQHWQTREVGYRVDCPSGHASWEVRTCASCGTRSPFLLLREAESDSPEPLDGDRTDRRYGSFLLAGPCWIRPRVFLCPRCGTCPEAGGADVSGCSRCTD